MALQLGARCRRACIVLWEQSNPEGESLKCAMAKRVPVTLISYGSCFKFLSNSGSSATLRKMMCSCTCG